MDMSPDTNKSDNTTIETNETITKPGGFFFILAKAQTAPVEQEDGSVENQTRILIQDPAQAETSNDIAEMTLDEFGEKFSGRIVALASRAEVPAKQRTFDLSWFIPAVVRYRKLFGEVLLASLFICPFPLRPCPAHLLQDHTRSL